MRRTAWLRFDWGSKINLRDISRGRLLANRIVLCADCDTNRALVVSSSAHLICSSCGSENWMFVSAPIVARLREFDKQKMQECATVPRHIARLERKDSFIPQPHSLPALEDHSPRCMSVGANPQRPLSSLEILGMPA